MSGVAEHGIVIASIGLVEVSTLLSGIMTPIPPVATLNVMDGDAEGLVLVTDLSVQGGVVVTGIGRQPSIPALQPTARGLRVRGGGVGVLGAVAHPVLVTDAHRPIVALVVPTVLTRLIAARAVVVAIIVTRGRV